ncbi:MAG TPA: SMI1/KNR4 family protein [Chryseolinea sp.]|nr:SMI1/KNR4 family protein [Chryseolinea sp.]
MAFPVDEQYITVAETELGLTFPSTFKEKMKRENGGEIETEYGSWTIHPFFDKSDAKRIKRTTNHIIIETRNSKEWYGFPENGVAIGDNGSGDKLVLLPTDSNPSELSDKIYVWLHETSEIEELANNIDELDD